MHKRSIYNHDPEPQVVDQPVPLEADIANLRLQLTQTFASTRV